MPSRVKAVYFDFDSTLVDIEGIDELARVLGVEGIDELTSLSMAGKIEPSEAYKRRLCLMNLQPSHLFVLARLYAASLVQGARETVEALHRMGYVTGIVSGGFQKAIEPVAYELGIDWVFAIELDWDEHGQVQVVPTPLFELSGKAQVLNEHAVKPCCFIGDGVTDFATRHSAAQMIPYYGIEERAWVRDCALPAYGGQDLRGLLPLILSEEEFAELSLVNPGLAQQAADLLCAPANNQNIPSPVLHRIHNYRSRYCLLPGPVALNSVCTREYPVMGHRSQAFSVFHQDLSKALSDFLQTSGRWYFSASSASAMLEASVASLAPCRILSTQSGAFARRFYEMACIHEHTVQALESQPGRGIELAATLEGLRTFAADAILLTASETSNGTWTDVNSMAKTLRSAFPELLILVDAVSAAGATFLDATLFDAMIFGSQKCLGLPPGLAIIHVSERYEKRMKAEPSTWYLDLNRYRNNGLKSSTIATPPVQIMQMLMAKIRDEQRQTVHSFEHHQALFEIVHNFCETRGLKIFAQKGFRSPGVTSISIPRAGFVDAVFQAGVELGTGYGEWKQSHFRIGHMGNLSVEELQAALRILEKEL